MGNNFTFDILPKIQVFISPVEHLVVTSVCGPATSCIREWEYYPDRADLFGSNFKTLA